MSQLEILAGRINALLDGINALPDVLWMLFPIAAWGLSLFTLVLALIAMAKGDWFPLLAVMFFMGLPLVVMLLMPLVPYGNIIGTCLMVLGLLAACCLLDS